MNPPLLLLKNIEETPEVMPASKVVLMPKVDAVQRTRLSRRELSVLIDLASRIHTADEPVSLPSLL